MSSLKQNLITCFLTIFSLSEISTINSGSNPSKTQNLQENTVLSELLCTKETTTIDLIVLTNTLTTKIAKESTWPLSISKKEEEDGSNTIILKCPMLISTKWLTLNTGESEDNGLQSSICINKFTWSTFKSSLLQNPEEIELPELIVGVEPDLHLKTFFINQLYFNLLISKLFESIYFLKSKFLFNSFHSQLQLKNLLPQLFGFIP